MIYLDSAATTKPYPEVIEAMNNAPWGNASTMSMIGIEARLAVKKVEDQLLQVCNFPEGKVVFTNSGSEANRLALNTLGPNILTSKAEHKSMKETFFRIDHLKNIDKNGQFHWLNNQAKDELATLISYTYSIMYVNNETGAINDPFYIGTVLKNARISKRNFISDHVAALGKHPIDLSHSLVDIATFSGHKIHGPKGVGAVVFNQKTFSIYKRQVPIFSSTVNVPAIVGFGKALEMINQKAHSRYVFELKELFIDSLQEILEREIVINAGRYNTSPWILNFQSLMDADKLIYELDKENIIISKGSACNTDSTDYSDVLKAMRLKEKEGLSSVRVSFDHTNTPEEVQKAALLIGKIIRSNGPYDHSKLFEKEYYKRKLANILARIKG
jgi:cysteine desulfurase